MELLLCEHASQLNLRETMHDIEQALQNCSSDLLGIGAKLFSLELSTGIP